MPKFSFNLEDIINQNEYKKEKLTSYKKFKWFLHKPQCPIFVFKI